MIKKLFTILIAFFFLHHCEYKPIYSDINKVNFKFNIINIEGDEEMNSIILSNLKKFTNTSSNKIFNLKITSNYIKDDLIKNKKGEIVTYLITNKLDIEVINDQTNKNFKFAESIETSNINNKFEFKKYERSIKNNFINNKINELILKLASIQ